MGWTARGRRGTPPSRPSAALCSRVAATSYAPGRHQWPQSASMCLVRVRGGVRGGVRVRVGVRGRGRVGVKVRVRVRVMVGSRVPSASTYPSGR